MYVLEKLAIPDNHRILLVLLQNKYVSSSSRSKNKDQASHYWGSWYEFFVTINKIIVWLGFCG